MLSGVVLPRVAVCLAAYNGSRWLEEQVSSILGQIGVDASVFISVDASSDGTEDLADNLANTCCGRLICLPYGASFGSAAQNFFRLLREVDFSSFDYVSFSDQDDIWRPDKLIRAIQVGKATHADAVSSGVLAFWPNGRTRIIKKNQVVGCWNHLFESAGPGCTYVLSYQLATCLGAALRQEFERCADVALHDWFVYAWAVSHGYSWHIDSYAGVLYRQHDANEFGANFGFSAARTRWYRLSGGWYRNQIIKMAELVGQETAWPIRRLVRFNFKDRIFLALRVVDFRRLWRDRIVLALAFLVMSR